MDNDKLEVMYLSVIVDVPKNIHICPVRLCIIGRQRDGLQKNSTRIIDIYGWNIKNIQRDLQPIMLKGLGQNSAGKFVNREERPI